MAFGRTASRLPELPAFLVRGCLQLTPVKSFWLGEGEALKYSEVITTVLRRQRGIIKSFAAIWLEFSSPNQSVVNVSYEVVVTLVLILIATLAALVSSFARVTCIW